MLQSARPSDDLAGVCQEGQMPATGGDRMQDTRSGRARPRHRPANARTPRPARCRRPGLPHGRALATRRDHEL